MASFERLRSNLYGANLFSGQIDLNPTHGLSGFFIVQHSSDAGFAGKQLLPLILAGCSSFHFIGEYRAVWNGEFLKQQHQLFLGNTEEPQFLSVSYDSLDSFAAALQGEMSIKPIVPHDIYLLYDDEALYQDVLHQLNDWRP